MQVSKNRYIETTKSSSTKNKTTIQNQVKFSSTTNNFDDNENTRGYRAAMHYFIKNLNKYYAKSHKDCLGELEEHYKMPLSREEQHNFEQNMKKIIQKNVDKMSRDILTRNANINRIINAYMNEYTNYKGSEKMSTIEIISLEESMKNDPEKYDPEKNIQSQKKSNQRPKSSCFINRKRSRCSQMWLSKNQQIACSINLEKNKEEIFRNTNNQMNGYFYIRQNLRKTFQHKKSLASSITSKNQNVFLRVKNKGNSVEDQFYSQFSNQLHKIFVNQKNQEKTKRPESGGGRVGFMRNCTVEDNSLRKYFYQKQPKKMSLNHVEMKRNQQTKEREKIQNKILMMTSAPSANIVSNHGYKPKSKCWGSELTVKSNTGIKVQVSKSFKN